MWGRRLTTELKKFPNEKEKRWKIFCKWIDEYKNKRRWQGGLCVCIRTATERKEMFNTKSQGSAERQGLSSVLHNSKGIIQ